MSDNTTRITLRLPSDIATTAKASADNEGVSLNEYIIAAVVAYSGYQSEIERRVSELENEIVKLRRLIK